MKHEASQMTIRPNQPVPPEKTIEQITDIWEGYV